MTTNKPYLTESYNDHVINVYDDAPEDTHKGDYRVELLYKDNKVRELFYPEDRIYTLLAHWTDSDLPTEPLNDNNQT